MQIEQQQNTSSYYKYTIQEDGREVARCFLFLIKNGLRDKPYALLEDVYVEEHCRGKGYGSQLVKHAIKHAKELECTKILATSRYAREKVHQLYLKLGFTDHGKEFRINF